MNCPRCNNDLRPGALFCDRCGAHFRPGEIPGAQQPYRAPMPTQQPVRTPMPTQQPYRAPQSAAPAAKPAKKRGALIAILASVGVVLIAAALVILLVVIPNSRYNAAMELRNAGNYEEALAAFEALGYNDNDEIVRDCRYEAAKKLYNTGRYDEAIPQLEALGDYRDSSTLRQDCRYFVALDLYNAGDYENALTALQALGGYKDSDALIADCNSGLAYDAAMRLYNAGSYEEALAAFEALGGYGDSAKQAEACRAQLWDDVSVGDTIFFGAYEQDNNASNGKEDIEWLVLARQGDSALVISRYGLDCQMFYPSMANVTWSSSSLRTWLNGAFLNSAFSTAEQGQIQNTTVSADRNPRYNTSAGSSTTDRIFLLSISEVGWYFSSDSDMLCKGTAYCYAQGAYIGADNNCWWWLRTPGDRMASAATVSSKGGINYSGNDVDAAAGAVRPAMWITLG